MKLSKRANLNDIKNLGKDVYEISEKLYNVLLEKGNKDLINVFKPIRHEVFQLFVDLEKKDILKTLTSNLKEKYKKAGKLDAYVLVSDLYNAFFKFRTNIEKYYKENGITELNPNFKDYSNLESNLLNFSHFFNEAFYEENDEESINKYEELSKEQDNEYGDLLLERYNLLNENEPKTANRKTLSKWAEEFEKKMENDYPEELEELRGPDEYDDVQWPPSAKKPKPTKLNYPLSSEEKWATFDKYVKIFEEDPNISKNQLYDLKRALEKTIWDK